MGGTVLIGSAPRRSAAGTQARTPTPAIRRCADAPVPRHTQHESNGNRPEEARHVSSLQAKPNGQRAATGVAVRWGAERSGN